MGVKCINIRPSVSRVRRDKCKTSVKRIETSRETSATRRETSRDTSGRQVKIIWPRVLSRETSKETSESKCKNTRPSVSRVG